MKQETWTRKENKQKINATRSQRLQDRQKSRYVELRLRGCLNQIRSLSWRNLQRRLRKQQENRILSTHKLSGGLKNSDVPIKDTNGNRVSSETGKLECWKEHFQTILNRPEPTETAQIPEAEEDVDVNTDQPTLEEV